jgi:ABC-type phosphate/phosphonate transport system substrate-binding protein
MRLVSTEHIALHTHLLSLIASLGLVGPAFAAEKDQGRPPDVVRIAVVSLFFRDIPEPLVQPLIEPFRALMMAQTGVKSEIVPTEDSVKLAQGLAENKIQVVFFQGFEFAWAKQACPELQPLMIAIHQRQDLRACLMARADSPIQDFADVKGKSAALPRLTQEHCWIYMERVCRDAGRGEPKKFFSSLSHPRDPEVDDLGDGKIEAVIVDNVALDRYRQRKPARGQRLKLVKESEVFPSAVIAYRAGTLDKATVKRFQKALLEGQHTALGRQLLTLWKITSLERVPANFEETLEKTLKAYPPPEKDNAHKEQPPETHSLIRRNQNPSR